MHAKWTTKDLGRIGRSPWHFKRKGTSSVTKEVGVANNTLHFPQIEQNFFSHQIWLPKSAKLNAHFKSEKI